MKPFKTKADRPAVDVVEPVSDGVSAEAVRWAFRLFLDQEPGDDTVEHRRRVLKTSSSLRRYFLDQPEFRAQFPARRVPALVGFEPPMEIEAVESEADLERLFAHIQSTWQHLGENEPHWSVSTADVYLQQSIGAHKAQFYESGRWDADRFTASLVRNGIDPKSLKSCLELGCGAARVTHLLADRFDRVIGYDISRAHLAVAREYLDGRGIANVTLAHLTGPDDLRALPKVDAAFTCVVLQHNPPPIIAMMIEGLVRALNPGGVAFFQVPTYYAGYRFKLADYLASEGASHEMMEMHVLPQRAVFEIVERQGARTVEMIEDVYTGCRPGEFSSTFLVQKR